MDNKKNLIRRCVDGDNERIFEIVNDAATAYRGVIPSDRWKEPYMPMEELLHEIREGVRFWGYEETGRLIGVMGIQRVRDVSLIRHAYIETVSRRKGIGGLLLKRLLKESEGTLLVGTWTAADWAVSFYEKHGFIVQTRAETERLLRQYWNIPSRQVETSVVLKMER
jgi:N-acetylglutamate synthase-like GNAT family acetyltransferase